MTKNPLSSFGTTPVDLGTFCVRTFSAKSRLGFSGVCGGSGPMASVGTLVTLHGEGGVYLPLPNGVALKGEVFGIDAIPAVVPLEPGGAFDV